MFHALRYTVWSLRVCRIAAVVDTAHMLYELIFVRYGWLCVILPWFEHDVPFVISYRFTMYIFAFSTLLLAYPAMFEGDDARNAERGRISKICPIKI